MYVPQFSCRWFTISGNISQLGKHTVCHLNTGLSLKLVSLQETQILVIWTVNVWEPRQFWRNTHSTSSPRAYKAPLIPQASCSWLRSQAFPSGLLCGPGTLCHQQSPPLPSCLLLLHPSFQEERRGHGSSKAWLKIAVSDSHTHTHTSLEPFEAKPAAAENCQPPWRSLTQVRSLK